MIESEAEKPDSESLGALIVAALLVILTLFNACHTSRIYIRKCKHALGSCTLHESLTICFAFSGRHAIMSKLHHNPKNRCQLHCRPKTSPTYLISVIPAELVGVCRSEA